eukprot:4426985-Amphidinium_carterae.1
MQQLAAEKIRSSQMQTHGAQLLFEKDTLFTQLVDLTRHAALNGARQDIQWTGNKEPEGFSVFVEQIPTSADAGIHVVPPFANQRTGAPPGLFDAVDEVPAPQTPDRRPKHTSSSPMFGLMASKDGSKGSGGNRMGADSTPDRVNSTPHSLSDRSDRNPRMVRGSTSTRRPGRGGDDGGDDDDDDDGDDNEEGFPIGGGNRGNQPF